jgi:hypothetical protein
MPWTPFPLRPNVSTGSPSGSAPCPPPIAFRPGVYIPLRGVIHRLKQAEGGRTVKIDRASAPTPLILVPGPREAFADKVRAFLRASARIDFAERVAVHAETLKVTPRSIAIKDMRSRWGSCSSEARLNFTWRLVCAPPFALDYVAAHEVAHIKEMNHSAKFWKQVERCYPRLARGPHLAARTRQRPAFHRRLGQTLPQTTVSPGAVRCGNSRTPTTAKAGAGSPLGRARPYRRASETMLSFSVSPQAERAELSLRPSRSRAGCSRFA